MGLLATSCSGPSIATCDEYAAMSESTGLLESRSPEQDEALSTALEAEDFDDGAYNMAIGHTEVVAYCNIYDGVAGQNHDEPITQAL